MNKFVSGFVAVVGKPNVGKSTLVNRLIGEKIAIMSSKPQTTRNKIMCILNTDNSQIVFVDTPGIHRPQHKLGEIMVRSSINTLSEVDFVLFVVDCSDKNQNGENYILELLQNVKTPVILLLNKVDKLTDKSLLLPVIRKYQDKYPFAAVLPISAIADTEFNNLLGEIQKHLPPGPAYYPDDMLTDQPERLVVAELIREKILKLTHDEVPHAIAVDVEEMSTRSNQDVYIRANIYVEKESQKAIVIGQNGNLLKQVGQMAREDIQTLLGNKVYLQLWVKIKKDWRNKSGALREFGFQD